MFMVSILLTGFIIFCLLVAVKRTLNDVLSGFGFSRKAHRSDSYRESSPVFASVVPDKKVLQIWRGKSGGYPTSTVKVNGTPVKANVVGDRILVSCEDGSTQTYNVDGSFTGSF